VRLSLAFVATIGIRYSGADMPTSGFMGLHVHLIEALMRMEAAE
jgi:hypothetical protein